jgi:hypothetical protein
MGRQVRHQGAGGSGQTADGREAEWVEEQEEEGHGMNLV